MRRSSKLSRRLLLAVLLGLLALFSGAPLAVAQPATPGLIIQRMTFVPPRTLKAELYYPRYDVNAPLFYKFTLEVDGQQIPESSSSHVGLDPRLFTVLFPLPFAPDGRARAVRFMVRDHPDPIPPAVSDRVSFTASASTPAAPPLGPAGQPLPPLPAPKEPSWFDDLGWKGWSMLALVAFGVLRWIWGALTGPSTPAPKITPAPSVPVTKADVEKPAAVEEPPPVEKPAPRRKPRASTPKVSTNAPEPVIAAPPPPPRPPPPPPRPLRLFYSYARPDEAFREELEKHLSTLRRSGVIEEWHDRRIGAGHEWAKEIDENLERADLVLLLISPDFLSSDYCYEVEMKRALERHAVGKALVVPVILRPSDWTAPHFQKLPPVPKNGTPISRWADRDEAWVEVVKQLRGHIEDWQKKLGIDARA